ncbi:MAG: hypothetical protein KDA44_06320 [Planctomycetales bacterium]|nr:hypothetical protein [Planctomycetales bacterium]
MAPDSSSFCSIRPLSFGRDCTALALLILAVGRTAYCADEDVATDYGNLLRGLSAQRDEIKTGIVSIRGFRTSNIGGENEFAGPVNYELCFDFPARRFRFDRTAPIWKNGRDAEADRFVAFQGGQFVRTPEHVLTRQLGSDRVSVLPPASKAPIWCKPLDIRALGLYLNYETEASSDLPAMLKIYATIEPQSIKEVEAGVFEVTSLVGASQRTMWIDSKRGFWPTKLIVRRRIKNQDGQLDWSTPSIEQVLEPRRFDGVWAPASYRLKNQMTEETLKFEWEGVNREIDPGAFEVSGLDLRGAKSVVDSTDGEPVIIEIDSKLPPKK